MRPLHVHPDHSYERSHVRILCNLRKFRGGILLHGSSQCKSARWNFAWIKTRGMWDQLVINGHNSRASEEVPQDQQLDRNRSKHSSQTRYGSLHGKSKSIRIGTFHLKQNSPLFNHTFLHCKEVLDDSQSKLHLDCCDGNCLECATAEFHPRTLLWCLDLPLSCNWSQTQIPTRQWDSTGVDWPQEYCSFRDDLVRPLRQKPVFPCFDWT